MSDLTVWKYIAPPHAEFHIDMPAGARLLHVAGQLYSMTAHRARRKQDAACVWALVDPAAPLEPRRFRMVGTGHLMPDLSEDGDAYRYVGTALLHDGTLVLHLFELVPATSAEVNEDGSKITFNRPGSRVSFGVDWPS